jgi:predicted transcriptional regulator
MVLKNKRHRRRIEIVFEILDACKKSELTITNLMYKTKLNYDILKKYLLILEKGEFLKRNDNKFVITSKGDELLRKIEELRAISKKYEEILTEINLEIKINK